MHRRSFFKTLPLSAAAFTPAGVAGPLSDTAWGRHTSFVPPPDMDYFTGAQLTASVDTSVSLSSIPFQAVAYNFPAWHASPYQEKYLGKAWTEYETMRRAKPLFDGHLQPKRPLWGYFNEADPTQPGAIWDRLYRGSLMTRRRGLGRRHRRVGYGVVGYSR